MEQDVFQQISDVFQQISAGLSLISRSHLASWNNQTLKLEPAEKHLFESKLHGKYDLLVSWILFSVGVEYLAKGVCLVTGKLKPKKVHTIRLPEDVTEEWLQLMWEDRAPRTEDIGYGTLNGLPVDKVPANINDQRLVSASIGLLASSIRNRDAHRYTQNVRSFHFHLVPKLFVPALNILLSNVDQEMLRGCLIDGSHD